MSAVESRAVRFHEYGEPLAVLREERTEVADPPAGTIRVRVQAVGLNPADWELCRGFLPGALPRGVGLDVAGVVEAIGPEVDGVLLGDRVFGAPDFLRQPSAGLADLAILNHWAPIPEGLGTAQASVLTMPVQTAVWTLTSMRVRPGETVLVHGAGSTVGYAAVQVALRMGARVIATAGSTYAADLEGFGALVTSYGEGMVERVRALAAGPIDHVLDAPPPNGGSIAALVEIAGDPDRVVTVSNHDDARRAGAHVNFEMISDPVPLEQLLVEYGALAAAGEFAMPIARTFPFADWRTAVEASLTGRARGKLVLLLDD